MEQLQSFTSSGARLILRRTAPQWHEDSIISVATLVSFTPQAFFLDRASLCDQFLDRPLADLSRQRPSRASCEASDEFAQSCSGRSAGPRTPEGSPASC